MFDGVGFVAAESKWITAPNPPRSDATGSYEWTLSEVSKYRVTYDAYADGVANPPPPGPEQIRSATEANYPVESNSATEYQLAIEGPGSVIIRGYGSAWGENNGISGGFPAFSEVKAGGGGSATLGHDSVPIRHIPESWAASVTVAAGDSGSKKANATTQPIEIDPGARWIKISDNTRVRARSSRTANTGGAASAEASGGWEAKFFPLVPPDLTCAEILADSVIPAIENGVTMTASFVPNGVDLGTAAVVCGVHHWSWVQRITDIPSDWTIRDSSGRVWPPFLDPYDAGPLTIEDASSGYAPIPILRGPLFLDSFEPYFDEVGSVTVLSQSNITQAPFVLSFFDTPHAPDSFLDPNDYLGFSTELVGIDEHHRVVLSTGQGFKWGSNAYHADSDPTYTIVGGGAFLSSVYDDTSPRIASGGVFGVEKFILPMNHAPNISSTVTLEVLEGHTVAIDLHATDADGESEAGGSLIYSIANGTDRDLFSIDANTGVLTFKAAPDFENPADHDDDNVYEVEVTVTDGGLLKDTKYFTIEITDVNEAPSLTLDPVAAIGEGDVAVLSGRFDDPDGSSSMTLDVDWGDEGNVQTIYFESGSQTFTLTHQFLDNARTIDESYIIRATVTDGDGNHDSVSSSLVVRNLDPQVTFLASNATVDAIRLIGESVTLSGTFSDPGGLDTHSVVVSWDDETTSAAMVDEATGAFVASHSYSIGGAFVPKVTIIDDDGGIAVAYAAHYVCGVRLSNDGELQVVGTGGTDRIVVADAVNGVGERLVRVTTQMALPSRRTMVYLIGVAEVERIVAHLGNGDDYFKIAATSVEGSASISTVVHAGPGDDRVSTASGNDVIYGEEGVDDLRGGSGSDLIMGGFGNDRLAGDDGNDQLVGDNDDDRLIGGEGNDLLLGNYGNDNLNGDSGDDVIHGGDGVDRVRGGDGNDVVMGESGDDTVEGDNGDDDLYGDEGNDRVRGGAGNDRLNGGTGADTLQGHNGDDEIHGDEGNDRLSGGDGNDLLMGGSDFDSIYGGNGEDQLHGDDGNDYLRGEEGNDVLLGGKGNDTLDGGNGQNLQIGDDGSDELRTTRTISFEFGDILIGGRRSPSVTTETLQYVLREQWINRLNARDDYVAVVTGLVTDWLIPGIVIFDDGEKDRLRVSSARELFFADMDKQDFDDDILVGKLNNDFVVTLP